MKLKTAVQDMNTTLVCWAVLNQLLVSNQEKDELENRTAVYAFPLFSAYSRASVRITVHKTDRESDRD